MNTVRHDIIRYDRFELRPEFRVDVRESHAPACTALKCICVGSQSYLLPLEVVHRFIMIEVYPDTADACIVHVFKLGPSDYLWVNDSNSPSNIRTQICGEGCQATAVRAVGKAMGEDGVGDPKLSFEVIVAAYCCRRRREMAIWGIRESLSCKFDELDPLVVLFVLGRIYLTFEDVVVNVPTTIGKQLQHCSAIF